GSRWRNVLVVALGMLILDVTPTQAQQIERPQTITRHNDWKHLTLEQRQALLPLKKNWHRLDTFHREKWIELAHRFPGMSPTEQTRMQERMLNWAALSPEQRRLAREHYRRAKKRQVEKSLQWEQYQQLSEEEKKELATRPAQAKSGIQTELPHTSSSLDTVPATATDMD